MKKLVALLFLGLSLNVYSQSIFNGYWNIMPLSLGMWMDDGEFNGVLSADLNLYSNEYLGDLGVGAELRTYALNDSLNDNGSGRITELGGRLVYGYYLGTQKFGINPYGGLTYGYLFGNDGTNTTAILARCLALLRGWGSYAEYVYSFDYSKSYITVGISLMGILKRNPPPPPPPSRPTPSPMPAPLTPPKVQPKRYPTLTPEELQKVELAYAETVRDIERRGKRLYIRNTQERVAFIQQYQGTPNTTVTNPLRKEVFGSATQKYYSSYNTSEKGIVALARNEPDVFRKVRMIHDWVSDIFSYDYDLLWWMDNVSSQNAVFTLEEIVKRERGVCLEYAILFYYLMDAAGIDTYLISDHSEPGIGHAYNMVVIDGTGYIIDTTWDSKNMYNQGRITNFQPQCDTKYFMLGISDSYKARGW